MIRFACPGCSATFTVGDEKAGKTGKCPKCQSQFVIPEVAAATADAPASAELAPLSPVPPPVEPPPLPTPASTKSDDPVEIRPCPKCQSRLSVVPSDLGLDIECPNCQRVYKAVRADALPPPDGDRDAPRGRLVKLGSGSDKAEEDDDRPSKRRSRYRDDDDEDDRPRRPRRRDDEDEENEDDPDRKYRRRRKRYADDYDRRLAPHRGVMILIFGVCGFAVCVIFGIMAWVMGSQDLREMDEGRMDPEGRGLTRAGQIIGMIVCLLNILVVVFYCALVGLIGIK